MNRPSPLLSVVVCVLGSALSCSPGLCASATAPHSLSQRAAVDPRAVALCAEVQSKLASITSLTAQFSSTIQRDNTVASGNSSVTTQHMLIRLMRPGFARVDTSLAYRETTRSAWRGFPNFMTYAADGAMVWRVEDGASFSGWRGSGISNISGGIKMVSPLYGLCGAENSLPSHIRALQSEDLLISLQYLGVHRWRGASYRVVRMEARHPFAASDMTSDYYIGSDFLIHHIGTSRADGTLRMDEDLTGIQVNHRMDPASFTYRLPATAKAEQKMPPWTPVMANGTQAPDFIVQDAFGRPVQLSAIRGKVIVLDFWATWCGNCLQFMPSVNKLGEKYKGGNVVVLGVDVGDTIKVFRSWLPEHAAQYAGYVFAVDPHGLSGLDVMNTLYHGSGLPSIFVIDASGKITASYYGYDGDAKADSAKLENDIVAAGGIAR